MGIVWEGTAKDFIKKVEKVADRSVGISAEVLVQVIQDSMPGGGANSFTKIKDRRLSHIASNPGNPPGVRTNHLKSSIQSQKRGKLKRVVGTNVVYAEIMEFGGTISHPGGTAYKIVGPGRAVFVKNSEATPGMKRTKPHTITIPARPFMRPGLQKASKKMVAQFVKSMNAGLK